MAYGRSPIIRLKEVYLHQHHIYSWTINTLTMKYKPPSPLLTLGKKLNSGGEQKETAEE